MIRIGIYGYGNLGRGVENAIKQNDDMELVAVFSRRDPASVKICTLLDKPERRKADIKADYIGAQVPDAFVVGYGLDYDEKYRNLPFVGILSPKVYE